MINDVYHLSLMDRETLPSISAHRCEIDIKGTSQGMKNNCICKSSQMKDKFETYFFNMIKTISNAYQELRELTLQRLLAR